MARGKEIATYSAVAMVLLPDRRVKENPSSWALVLGKDKEESEVLPVENKFIEEQKEHTQGRWAKPRRASGARMVRYGVFKTRFFYIFI